MAVGRGEEPGSRAAMAVTVDEPVPEGVLNALVQTPGFTAALSVRL
jgi:D-3-phosphoglycerate dehydrogenase